MKLLDPAYRVVAGSRKVDTTSEPKASTLVDLVVDLGLDVPIDSATIVLGNVNGLRPELGDASNIDLGYADEPLERVISGRVVSVDASLPTRRVTVHSPAAELAGRYVAETFEERSAGEIVRSLASDASIDVARTEDGIHYPAFAVARERSVLETMHELARHSGFDLYFDEEGELHFAPFRGGRNLHELRYAEHILELEVTTIEPRAVTVELRGEGPSSSGGEGSWAWLTKADTQTRATAGSGDPVVVLDEPAIRTTDGAQTAADAALRDIERRATRGRLLTFGNPAVRLGDAVQTIDVPEERLNALFQVRGVRHRIVKNGGFTTEISIQTV